MVFIAPALTSGAITGERERQTYDLLRTTLLSEPTFVLGKLESALAYLFMLLLAAIPLQSVAFLFGGVSEVEIALAFIVLAVTALALGAIGVTVSTGTDRTISASVRAYGLALALMFAVPLMASIGGEVMQRLLMPGGWTSPLMETAMAYVNTVLTAINPAAALLGTQQILIERNSAAFYPYTISSTGGTIPMVSPWVLFTVIYLTLSAVLIALAVRRMRQRDIQAA
jgi:ABC-type transport system involved in multi-copper enzyme maturation permease subunit